MLTSEIGAPILLCNLEGKRTVYPFVRERDQAVVYYGTYRVKPEDMASQCPKFILLFFRGRLVHVRPMVGIPHIVYHSRRDVDELRIFRKAGRDYGVGQRNKLFAGRGRC